MEVMAAVAFKYQKTIPLVAMRWVLQQEGVESVIVGSRIGVPPCDTTKESAALFSFALDDEDFEAIQGVTKQARKLSKSMGDVGEEFRRIDENGHPMHLYY
mmetsp:Transcript_11300/g.21684  ORF Transcript_11300/g.21684 Transcript_11300/m.21684 type:complete len:101 (-) Transcript_11300:233-535(-)